MQRGRCDPLEHIRMLVLKARGNTVTLKPKMLCGGRRTALVLLKALTDAGYLKKIGDGKYLLQRGSPLWEALEQGKAAKLLEQLRNRKETQNRGNRKKRNL